MTTAKHCRYSLSLSVFRF